MDPGVTVEFLEEFRPFLYGPVNILVKKATEPPFFIKDPVPVDASLPHKLLPLPVRCKIRKIVSPGMIDVAGGYRGITLSPIRGVPLLAVVDFFAGVESVALPRVGEKQHIGIINDADAIMTRKQVGEKVFCFAVLAESISEI
jgi:hypothetical protein